MQATVQGSPSFAYLDVWLEPGETVRTEADAMATMAADLDMEAKLNGSFFGALGKKILGGESFFINAFRNNVGEPRHLTLAQGLPGDMVTHDINAEGPLCLQPGAYVASTEDVTLGLSWAGLVSGISREGFFKLEAGGSGTVWFGAFGGLVEKQLDGETIVDTAHLVAYEPAIKLRIQLAGGLFSSLFSGEGLVTRLKGQGRYWIQTRSLSGLAGILNPKL